MSTDLARDNFSWLIFLYWARLCIELNKPLWHQTQTLDGSTPLSILRNFDRAKDNDHDNDMNMITWHTEGNRFLTVNQVIFIDKACSSDVMLRGKLVNMAPKLLFVVLYPGSCNHGQWGCTQMSFLVISCTQNWLLWFWAHQCSPTDGSYASLGICLCGMPVVY